MQPPSEGAPMTNGDHTLNGAYNANAPGQNALQSSTYPPSQSAFGGKQHGLNGADEMSTSTTRHGDVVCGPLLNYNSMSNTGSREAIWHGSVLYVTSGRSLPNMRLKYQGPWKRQTGSGAIPLAQNASNGLSNGSSHFSGEDVIAGEKLYEDPGKAFWRYTIHVPLQDHEVSWAYSIGNIDSPSDHHNFVVPSYSQSMRIMFHSCNGFSVGTDEDAWSGPALWNDVMRNHAQKPFHVMVGGGDQIYNDSIRVKGPLKTWTEIKNPHKRREHPFDESFRTACDKFYYENYVTWYSTEQFARANSRIAQINIWDDHDIIDGFGSYTDHFMNCAVFRGIGAIAFKYYCLFQHHAPPPVSTFTTSASQTMESQGPHGAGADPVQLEKTYVRKDQPTNDCYILGPHPGPYIPQRSRSIYMRLGARMAFLGLDARTERTRMQINYPETYDLVFDKVNSDLSSHGISGSGKVSHLIVLLGVPIAYPRLIFLENILRSPIIGPIQKLSKHFGVAGGLFNKFDGGVDLLDDLDDHYTARHHKEERKMLMQRLQLLAEKHGIRITILGGDVHLAAVGRFYSKPKLHIPAERDHRYMVNIVSSAITNKPPPQAVANLLARRNKIHHLDHHTDETLMIAFDKDPGTSSKTADHNKVTMPSRNYAIITESSDPIDSSLSNGHDTNGHTPDSAPQTNGTSKPRDGHAPLHAGEEGAGTKHVAADGISVGGMKGGLDVSIRVEVDQHDREGTTEGYGFSIPALHTKI